MADKEHTPHTDIEFRLYVVLHGLICLVDDGDQFVAYLPDLKEQHKYLYGDWLVEDEIPPRAPGQEPFTAELHGVYSGRAHLDPNENPVMKIAGYPADTYTDIRAQITLPRPRCIHHFLCGEVAADAFSRVDEFVGGKAPNRVCAIRVFEYSFPSHLDENDDDINNVRLEGVDGTAIWTCPDLAEVIIEKNDKETPVGPFLRVCMEDTRTLKVAVLHIFNEPDHDLKQGSEKHNIEEFALTSKFLGAKTQLRHAPLIDGDDSDLPPGLLEGEVDPLSVRHQTVLLLLLANRTGVPSEGVGGGSGPACMGANG
ncbi:MAG TPA: hypothetical protein VHA33_26265 [Candidatus Angelobacter sp.]|jgi:ferredoxin|nr:hypothetical protein [Candidatus Angelobacter sp.]